MDEVNPETVLYSEFWSSDLATQFMSGCNSPAVAASRDWERQGLDLSPTGTDLFRFYFPDFKLIEITSEDEAGFGLSLFNGNGIHGSFRGTEAERLLDSYHRLWRQNVDCFTSDDVQALLETGIPDVYLNRFGDGDKQLYTVWNSAKETKAKVKLPVKVRPGARCIDIINSMPLPLTTSASGAQVAIDLPGRMLSSFAIVKPVLTVQRHGPRLHIIAATDAKTDDAVLEVEVGRQVILRPLQNHEATADDDQTVRPLDAIGLVRDIDLSTETTAVARGIVVRLLVKGCLIDLVTL
jgi:hypothetical protein